MRPVSLPGSNKDSHLRPDPAGKPARRVLTLSLLAGLLFCGSAGQLLAQPRPVAERFSFGLIGQKAGAGAEESFLGEALARSDADNLAFVVVNGIKAVGEPCTDKLYEERRRQYDSAKNGLFLSLAGSDWADCRSPDGRPAALERLRRVRDLFYNDEFSLGASRIPLSRQSIMPKFYTYVENMRWEFGDVLFATLNLPANNNQYSPDAGRNGEFEDRLIANRDWLKRLFVIAASRKFAAVVIFSDGSLAPNGGADTASRNIKRDGFLEMRNRVSSLAAKFPGKVLLVQRAPSGGVKNEEQKSAGKARQAGNRIVWQGNVGQLTVPAGASKIMVDHRTSNLLTTVTPGQSR